MAGGLTIAVCRQHRLERRACVNGDRATRMERTTLGEVTGEWRIARHTGWCVAKLSVADPGKGSGERPGVWMQRASEYVARAALLDDPAGVHDGHPVAGAGENGQIVADEHDAQSELLNQRRQQVEDLGLHHDIERSRGFVGDEQFGSAGQGHGDHHSLLLPAGELMRVGTRPTGRQTDLFQKFTDPRACGLTVRRPRAAGSVRRVGFRCAAPG